MSAALFEFFLKKRFLVKTLMIYTYVSTAGKKINFDICRNKRTNRKKYDIKVLVLGNFRIRPRKSC